MWFTCDYHVTPCYSNVLCTSESCWCVDSHARVMCCHLNHITWNTHTPQKLLDVLYTRLFPYSRAGSGNETSLSLRILDAQICKSLLYSIIMVNSDPKAGADLEFSLWGFWCSQSVHKSFEATLTLSKPCQYSCSIHNSYRSVNFKSLPRWVKAPLSTITS